MEHNLIARKVIKDHVQSVGGLKQLLISKEPLQSVSCPPRKSKGTERSRKKMSNDNLWKKTLEI